MKARLDMQDANDVVTLLAMDGVPFSAERLLDFLDCQFGIDIEIKKVKPARTR